MATRRHPSKPLPLDVISRILAGSNNATLAVCARVCRDWQEPALDSLWRSMVDVVPLFQILSPMSKMEKGSRYERDCYKFKPVETKKWDRFYFYSNRIKSLTVKTTELHVSVFQELGRGQMDDRPMFSKLTNFQMVHCRNPLLYSAFFLQRNVLTLDITLLLDQEKGGSYLKELDIATRTPNLQDLSFRCDYGALAEDVPEAALAETLTRLTRLRNFSCTDFLLTSDVVAVLAALPHLHTISGVRLELPQAIGTTWSPVLRANAFPSLRNLSVVETSYPDFSHLLSNISAPQLLSSLTFSNIVYESRGVTGVLDTPKSTGDFLQVLSSRCTNLTQLCIDLSSYDCGVIARVFDSSTCLRFANIRPLLAIHTMTSFTLRHPHRLVLVNENVLEIIQAWPAIERLWLNPYPLSKIPKPQGLTPSCLVSFKNRSPALRELGMHIDFPKGDFPVLSRSSYGALAGLKLLDMGTSPVEHVNDTAIFLSSLLTSSCVFDLSRNDIYATPLSEVLEPLPDDEERIQENWGRWDEVASILPIEIRAREEEREM